MMLTSKRIKIGIISVAVILVVVLFVFYFISRPSDPIKQQLKAFKANDFIQAYSYTSKEFQRATPLSAFEEFVNRNPILKNNVSSSFSNKEIKGDVGVVNGVIRAADGAVTPVEYHLVIEDGVWKILEILIKPGGVTEVNESNQTTSSQWKIYKNNDSRYSINYPGNWNVEASEPGTVIFSGKNETPSYYSTVNIQTVLTKQTGGDYSTVKDFMADIKHQASTQSAKPTFFEHGPFTLKDANGATLKGEYLIFKYTYKNVAFKQWQIVIMRNDNQVFYAWAYTSPIDQYSHDMQTAKAMLASWSIY